MTVALSQEQVDLDFEAMFRNHRRELVCYAKKLTFSWFDAEDVVQHAFLTAISRQEEWDGAGRPIAWLTALTKYTAFNLTRRRQRQAFPASDLFEFDYLMAAPDAGTPDADVRCMADEETVQAVEAVLESLPPRRRLAVELWCIHDFSWSEVAEYMETTVKTVQALAYTTLERLAAGRKIPDRPAAGSRKQEVLDLLMRPGALDGLAPRHRQILAWRYVEGLTVSQVAGRLGVGLAVVHARSSEARAALRALAGGAS